MSHEPRELRELRFTAAVHAILQRGGKCLIPVFALGRSQELLLILDAYWRDHPELHKVPLYYASGIAKRCMRIYQTYINMMNEHIRSAHAAGTNPWDFKHGDRCVGRGATHGVATSPPSPCDFAM